MTSENKNGVVEKELADSDDDGFEVLDPEPEPEADDFKHLSRNDFTNAGTIIFCHMEDEYNSIQQVSCQYIRPEGWNEQEKDEIAIFEVGWINTEEAVAKIPVDRTISKGYPLGSVDLTEFAFRKEEYAAYAGEVSHFQFCYLRDGMLLGASTPFGIRGIKAVSRLSLMGGKPLFLPRGEIAADGNVSNSLPADSLDLDLFETSAVNAPPLKHHEQVELSELESSLQNLTLLTKKLQNQRCNDKTQTSESAAKLIGELSQSVDELTVEMQKARKVLPTNVSMVVTPTSSESCQDFERRFRSCAMQLESNLQDCTRTFDLCKVAIKNQTPPCSLSELEVSDYFRGADGKRQQDFEQLEKRLKEAEGEIERLREELSSTEKERCNLNELQKLAEERNVKLGERNDNLFVVLEDVKKNLIDKETELKQVKEELSVKDNDLLKSNDMLCSAEDKFTAVNELLLQKESECEELKKRGEDFGVVNKGMTATIEELMRKVQNAEEVRVLTEQNMKSQLEVLMKRLEEVNKELSFKESNHRRYVVEASSLRMDLDAELKATSEDCSGLRSQITTLQEEAKLYKSKLGETIVELANSRRETDDLKSECKKLVEHLNFLESEKTRLLESNDDFKEKLKTKRSDPTEHDVLIQEFLRKSEELNVARQQVENFQDELSRLNVQRTTLQKELLEARQNPPSCEKPCCTFEVDPGVKPTDCVVQSILESLEQSLQENKRLQRELDTEKQRSQTLDEKLQSAAGVQRHLFMEKITLESRLNELLGRD